MKKQPKESSPKKKRKPSPAVSLDVFRSQLRLLVDEAGSQYALAKRTGLSQAVISKWLIETSPEAPGLAKLALGTGVSLNWLLLGEGPRERRAPTGEPLETQLGAYLRARLSEHQRQVEGMSSGLLSEGFAHLHNWDIGRATLVRLEDLLVPEFVAADQHIVRIFQSRQLYGLVNEHWKEIPRPLGKILLASLDKSTTAGPAAAAMIDALNGAALERVAAEQDRLKRSAAKEGK